MSNRVRRSFWLALSVSLVMHVAALVTPGWRLPVIDSDLKPARLDARLVPSSVATKATSVPSAVPLAARQQKPSLPRPELAAVHASDPSVTPMPPSVIEPELRSVPEPLPELPPVPVAVSPAPTFADVWPRGGRLVFNIVRGDGFWVGKAEHSWRHDGQRYQLRAVTETIGLAALFHSATVTQESSGIFLF